MSIFALKYETQYRAQKLFANVGIRRANYLYTWRKNHDGLEHYDKYGHDFDYCLASCSNLNFSRDFLVDCMFYGLVFSHSKSNEWRVLILEDVLPDKFRTIGLAKMGYHLKQRIVGRPIFIIDDERDVEEKEAICEEMRIATLEDLVEEYIDWTESIFPSRVVKLRKALQRNKRKRK